MRVTIPKPITGAASWAMGKHSVNVSAIEGWRDWEGLTVIEFIGARGGLTLFGHLTDYKGRPLDFPDRQDDETPDLSGLTPEERADLRWQHESRYVACSCNWSGPCAVIVALNALEARP